MSRLAPFLAEILRRHPPTATLRGAAEAAGVSHVAIGEVLRGRPASVGVEKLEAAARAAGATADELRRLRALAALDRGSLPVPSNCTEEQALAALDALEGA